MNQPKNFPKVATDMFLVQGIWASGFLGIMLLIQIVKSVLFIFNDNNGVNTFYDATFIASNIFMLVIGIISAVGFIPHYVSNGVTRKDYFKGGIIGAIGLALAIPIISLIVSSLLTFILKLVNLPINIASFDNRGIDSDGEIIGDLVISIIFSPYVDLSSNWLLAIAIFALNIFTYYVVGWLIGATFSRLGVYAGIFSILLGFLVVHAEDILISMSLGLSVPSFVGSIEIPLALSVFVIIIMLAICLWVIRQLTKRIIVRF